MCLLDSSVEVVVVPPDPVESVLPRGVVGSVRRLRWAFDSSFIKIGKEPPLPLPT